MIVAFTISTNLYLPQAVTLGLSFLKKNPFCEFYIVLLDNFESYVSDYIQVHNLKCIYVHDIGINRFEDMRLRYSAFEMSCALKPFVAKYFIHQNLYTNILYFDSDILVLNKVEVNFDYNYSMAITPHCTEPLNRLDYDKMDLSILNHGLYNAGFFILNTSNSECHSILDWWCDRLFKNCISDLRNGKYVDQIWLNLMPIYFKSVHIIYCKTYNVAPWNLDERNNMFTNSNGYSNGSMRLKFFHFSGFKYYDKRLSSTHSDVRPNIEVLKLYQEYRSLLKACGVESFNPLNNYYKRINLDNEKKISVNTICTKYFRWALKK